MEVTSMSISDSTKEYLLFNKINPDLPIYYKGILCKTVNWKLLKKDHFNIKLSGRRERYFAAWIGHLSNFNLKDIVLSNLSEPLRFNGVMYGNRTVYINEIEFIGVQDEHLLKLLTERRVLQFLESYPKPKEKVDRYYELISQITCEPYSSFSDTSWVIVHEIINYDRLP
mgnify:FL=1